MCILSFLLCPPMSMRTLRFYLENEDNGSAYYERPNEYWLPLFTELPRAVGFSEIEEVLRGVLR